MPEHALDQSQRLLLATLAREKNRRIVGSPPQHPSHWTPHKVINPESGLPFSDVGAWHFIANLLECGHPVEELVLDTPPGAKAYVMKFQLTPKEELYMKFHLGLHNKIIGRSFHISEL